MTNRISSLRSSVLLVALFGFFPALSWAQPSFTITAACPMPVAVVGVPYSFTVSVINGAPPYTWEGEDLNVPGLTLNTSTGVLSGTPTTPGTYAVNVEVIDFNGTYLFFNCNLTVNNFQITAACPAPGGMVGAPYSFTVTVAGTSAVTWTLTSGVLPTGLTLNSTNGIITGIPAAYGTYLFTITVALKLNPDITQNYMCGITIAPAALVITTVCPISTVPITLTATGGVGGYVFSIIGSLPPGLTLNNNVISGQVPTTPGSYPFTLQVTSGAQEVQEPCSIVVAPPGLQITSGCPASPAPEGSPISYTLTATGGVGGYLWSIVPGLPAGLTLTGNVISGAPTGPTGTVNFTIEVSSGTATASIPCSLTVTAPRLVITSGCPGNGMVGVAYGPFVLTATGGLGATSYTFSVQGNLPPGVSLTGNTISGTPTTAGMYLFSYTVLSGGQSAVSLGCSVTIATAPLQVTGNCPTAPFTAGSPVSISFAVTGGQAPYTYTAGGASWLTVSSSGSTATLSGTPGVSNIGTFSVTLTVTDANHTSAESECNLTVNAAALQIGGSCPASSVTTGSPVSAPFTAAGGVPPYNWALAGNSGLSLTAQGASASIAGNAPSAAGSYSFTVTLSDSAKTPAATLSCSLNVQLPPLEITGTCPASALSLPLTLSIPLSAGGGEPPYTWKFSGPSWISLSGTTGAAVSITSNAAPSAPGPFSFSVTLSDAANSTPTAFSCSSSINAPTPPPVTVTGLTLQPSLLQPTAAGIQLGSPALLPITGVVTLSFIPNAFGITDNPQVTFNGGTRTASFTIAPGQTSFTLPTIQEGTDAGTIQLQVTDLQQGGVEVLTAPYPTTDLVIPREAPVIATTDVSFADEVTNGFTVVINGLSTPRDMQSVTLTFTAAAGASLSGTTSFTVNVSSLFSTYYSSAASQMVGSQWQGLQVPVTTTGDKTAIGAVAVTMTNSVGNSQTITLQR